MNHPSRRFFLYQAAGAGIALGLPFPARWFGVADEPASQPHVQFPAVPHERIAVASYPFREFIRGKHDAGEAGANKMALKDFAAYTRDNFGIARIEPWSEHFLSLEPAYLSEIRAAAEKAGGAIVDLAADGRQSAYSPDKAERDAAVAFSKTWIDAAATLASPSVRTNISPAKDAKRDAALLLDSLRQIADYAAQKGVVVHLENDNPLSEDPFFLADVIGRLNHPWLHALPDFGNSVAALPPQDAYRGVDEMFAHAYGISHVKSEVVAQDGKIVQVDVARTFAVAANHHYRGYFSMEWDSPGDPHAGTKKLIAWTLQSLGRAG